MLRLLNEMVLALEGQARLSLAHRVRRVLRNSVLAGTANARHVGEIFSLSERGLRRHLAREGVSLNELIGEARFVVAEQLLEQTGMPLGEIAGALHYADLSAFSRAFRGWTGVAPSAWRLSVQSANGEARRDQGRRFGTCENAKHGTVESVLSASTAKNSRSRLSARRPAVWRSALRCVKSG